MFLNIIDYLWYIQNRLGFLKLFFSVQVIFNKCYFCCSKIVDRSSEYINRSLMYECENWERGHAVSFLGIHISDLLCNEYVSACVLKLRPIGQDWTACKLYMDE
jgi:hypothetical protein